MSTLKNAVLLLVIGISVLSGVQVCKNMQKAVRGMSLLNGMQDTVLAVTERVSTLIDTRPNSPANPIIAKASLLFSSP
jgi:hypothetical protein